MADSKFETLIVGRLSPNNGCLGQYLNADARKTKTKIPGPQAVADSANFTSSILNLTDQMQSFLDTQDRQRAFLVLGKIQSGKTAHLLGSVAWAADSKIALASIFTGVTDALNEQTVDRVQRSLAALGDSFLRVNRVPTNKDSVEYRDLKSKVERDVEWRLSETGHNPTLSPLPVLVTLKNAARVRTLKHLLGELEIQWGAGFTVLLVDDEADQASQNAGAQKRTIASTYRAISEVRELGIRNIMLSYTATPQAVLLAERLGKLRPDRCATVAPRHGYFGLQQLVSDDYSVHRVEIGDWTSPPSTLQKAPKSLRNCLLEYFWVAWFRFHLPELFYHASGVGREQLIGNLESVQMMIHESARVAEHYAMYKLVNSEKDRLANGLRNFLVNEMSAESRLSFLAEMGSAYRTVVDRLSENIAGKSPGLVDEEMIANLFGLVDACQLLVVNSNKNRPTAEIRLPVTDKQWELHKTWIIIGGDILGRGLTIPQLVSTYFLRSATAPNFDTVSQQMRFCGYRNAYKEFTSLWATPSTLGAFKYMNTIDTIVWDRAQIWDKQHVDLARHLPVVLYAAPSRLQMEPTRRAVRDPNLKDRRITGGSLFSARKIFRPSDVASNSRCMRNWIDETRLTSYVSGNWRVFEDVPNSTFQRLLATWQVHGDEWAHLLGATELFEADMGNLGLADVPRLALIAEPVVSRFLDTELEIGAFLSDIKVGREIHTTTVLRDRAEWIRTMSANSEEHEAWADYSITHIGDSQRRLKSDFEKQLGYSSTVLIVEPIVGMTQPRDITSAICAGFAFSLLSPVDFEVRIVGHQ